MNEEERRWVQKQISNYYSHAQLTIDRLEQREFGVGFEKKIERRHIEFANTDNLRMYLVNNAPLYISHSAAFYNDPAATPIERKEWKGAEIIFDLDAQISNKYDQAAVIKIKDNVITLIEDFLITDFGISRQHISVVFSGNRGYHIYIKDPAFFDLGSNERREIVDYVCGTGLDYKQFFTIDAITKKTARITGPKPTESGWRGRLVRMVLKIVETDPKRLSRKFKKENERALFISGINEGTWSKTSVPDIIEVIGKVVNDLQANKVIADAAVTYDITRLIRMQNSIHGGAGLIAKPVDNLEKFNPFDSAIVTCDPIPVEFIEEVPKIEFANTSYGQFKKGEKMELLGALALFLLLKGSVKYF